MSKRVAWFTDIHLDFLSSANLERFYLNLRSLEVDLILLGGDIGEAHNVTDFLLQISHYVQQPIYFVLGNHDFYGSSIQAVRDDIQTLVNESPNLHYLSISETPIELTPSLALIGHDGWADLQYGDFKNSSVWMRDYDEIDDFKGLKKAGLLPVMQRLGQEAGRHIQNQLTQAIDYYEKVLILTHLPPYEEACWHEGKISDNEWLPHFTCKAIGDAIRDTLVKYPAKSARVLCGHTHGSGQGRILPNLVVLTKDAEYEQVQEPHIWSLR